MNTKTKKQNPPKPEANSKFLIFNFKLFNFFRSPFSVLRFPFVIRNSSFVIFFRFPFLLVPFSLLLFTSCPEPTPPDYGLSLEAVDIVCTEATFKVSAGIDSTSAWDCGLYRDDSLVISQSISGGVGYLRDTGLEPNASYNYHIGYLKKGKAKDRSQVVNITTLDTTSSSFAWSEEHIFDEPCDFFGIRFRTVDIVSDDNIWIGGAFCDNDSFYNVTHWDGSQWTYYNTTDKSRTHFDFPVFDIQFFNENNIWMLHEGSPAFYNGESTFRYRFYQDYPNLPHHGINTLWGSAPDDVWFGAYAGAIYHWDGETFHYIHSGTDMTIWDMDGTSDGTVYLVAYNNQGCSCLLRIKDTTPEIVWESEDANEWIYRITVIEDVPHLVSNDGIRRFEPYSGTMRLLFHDVDDLFDMGPYRIEISGPSRNDLLIASPWKLMFHYNGKRLTLLHIRVDTNCRLLDMDYNGITYLSAGMKKTGQPVFYIGGR